MIVNTQALAITSAIQLDLVLICCFFVCCFCSPRAVFALVACRCASFLQFCCVIRWIFFYICSLFCLCLIGTTCTNTFTHTELTPCGSFCQEMKRQQAANRRTKWGSNGWVREREREQERAKLHWKQWHACTICKCINGQLLCAFAFVI